MVHPFPELYSENNISVNIRGCRYEIALVGGEGGPYVHFIHLEAVIAPQLSNPKRNAILTATQRCTVHFILLRGHYIQCDISIYVLMDMCWVPMLCICIWNLHCIHYHYKCVVSMKIDREASLTRMITAAATAARLSSCSMA